ncbi:MAG: SprB repeat-containing protein, partial [Bacteroidia bacterium]|nr:SprB repeat-containing protein [Bacteroidia bacterium]
MKKYLFVAFSFIVAINQLYATHFTYNHTGNPYNPMSFVILGATINGVNISTGDEIAVFDGTLCVGVGVFDGTLPYGFSAGMDDPITTSVIDGFTAGDAITYKFWDVSASAEITNIVADYAMGNGLFSSQGTAIVTLTGTIQSQLSASISVASPINCYDSSTGSLHCTVTNGTSPYSYLWSNSATTQNINNLPAGNYSVTITDNSSSTTSASIVLTQPPLITPSVTGINIMCYGASTGSIDLTVSGGISPYTFHWSGSQTTEDLSNIPAGTYLVTVTDTNGCTASASKTITQPTQISTSMTGTNVMCYGASTGSIDLTVSGGISPYT